MNKTRNESKYKYYCTTDPATWEIIGTGEVDIHVTDLYREKEGDQTRSRATGGFSGERRGGGMAPQRTQDNGWEGRRANVRTMGSKVDGTKQIATRKQGNGIDFGSSAKDKNTETSHHSNNRKYKQATQKESGTSQTMLNEFWKGREKDLRTWLEEMEELEGLESLWAQNSQESVLSYV